VSLLDPKVILRLTKNGIPKEEFESQMEDETEFELLKAQGMNIVLENGNFKFQSAMTSVDDTLFCIADIESNGSKPSYHQIIEIGAVKLQNGRILDTYESLVYCTDISIKFKILLELISNKR
jgi:DNA polymerase III subunit epsilon